MTDKLINFCHMVNTVQQFYYTISLIKKNKINISESKIYSIYVRIY